MSQELVPGMQSHPFSRSELEIIVPALNNINVTFLPQNTGHFHPFTGHTGQRAKNGTVP